jgi:hypothetical protein
MNVTGLKNEVKYKNNKNYKEKMKKLIENV